MNPSQPPYTDAPFAPEPASQPEKERDTGRTVIVRKNNSMRNLLCICGSKKKFKKCCWGKYK